MATSPSTDSLTTATFHGPQWTIAARVLGADRDGRLADELADVEDRQDLATVREHAGQERRARRAAA